MILLFPLPGYVAKLVQDVQVVRLKKTDARVETVSEGVFLVFFRDVSHWSLSSHECPSHAQTVRMGEEDERTDR